MSKAIHTGNSKKVQWLLSTGYHPDCSVLFGNTPLIHAAVHNQKDIIHILLQHGANLERHNQFSVIPFLASIMFKNFEIAQLLLQHGANQHNTKTLPDIINDILLHHQSDEILDQKIITLHTENVGSTDSNTKSSTSHYALTQNDLLFLEAPAIHYSYSDRIDSLLERLQQYTRDINQVKNQEFKRTYTLFTTLSKELPIAQKDLLCLIISFESAYPLHQAITHTNRNDLFNMQ